MSCAVSDRMSENQGIYRGVHAIVYALFCKDESIDAGAMAAQVAYCHAAECHGVAVLGLATEVLKLTPGERRMMIEIVGRANAGKKPFGVTIAGNSIGEQSELARIAQENGADWLIVQPPMVGNYSADVYLDFIERVVVTTGLPIAIQNAPQYLGRAFSATDIARLRARCGTLVAIKSEDSVAAAQQIIDAAQGLHVLAGRGGLDMTDMLRIGCTGFVFAPDIVPVAVQVFNKWLVGERDDAENLYKKALPAIEFSMESLEHLITYGKRIFAQNAGITIHDRAPCLASTAAGLDRAKALATHLATLHSVGPQGH